MATRMQQRRGTAAQWTAANPILAAGEIGFETDTNKFKMGNGTSTWSALQYFANAAELAAIVDNAPEFLNTLNELAAAIGDDPDFLTALATNARVDQVVIAGQASLDEARNYLADSLASHVNNTYDVHGIANTANLSTKQYAEDQVSAHNLTTVNVHGIADTAELATITNVTTAKNEAIADAALASEIYTNNSISALTKASVGLGAVDNTEDALKPVSAAQASAIDTAKTAAITAAGQAADIKVSDHNTDTTNVHGIADTSVLVTQTDLSTAIAGVTVDQASLAGTGIDWNSVDERFDIDSTVSTKTYADGAVSTHNSDTTSVHGISDTAHLVYDTGATFTGDVTVETNLTIDGNLTVSGTTTTVSAQDLVVSDPLIYLGEGNSANLSDLGFVANFNDGSYQHTGLVRDSSDGKWKLFKGVTDEPTSTVNFAQGSMDALKVGALEATTITPSSGIVFSDGTQVKVGVPSITAFATAISSSATLAAGESDKFVPLTGAVTITLPASGYVKGQSIDFYQESGTGAQFASTNGVVGTPGLKFRTTNSVATAMKTDSGWLVFGDLSA